jgi:hypothetical protein
MEGAPARPLSVRSGRPARYPLLASGDRAMAQNGCQCHGPAPQKLMLLLVARRLAPHRGRVGLSALRYGGPSKRSGGAGSEKCARREDPGLRECRALGVFNSTGCPRRQVAADPRRAANVWAGWMGGGGVALVVPSRQRPDA